MSQSHPQPHRPAPPTHRASLANPSTTSSSQQTRPSSTAAPPTQRPASVANPSTSSGSNIKNPNAVSAAQSRMVRIAATALVADKGVVALPPPHGEGNEGAEEDEERVRVVMGEGVVVHPFGRVDATGLGGSAGMGDVAAGRKRKRKAPRIELGEGCVVWEKACVGGAFPGSAPRARARRRTEGADENTEEEREERPGVHLSTNVTIHPHATIYSHYTTTEPSTIPTTHIGPHTTIHHSAILSPSIRLGSNVTITAGTFIPPDTVIGDNAIVTPDKAGAQCAVRLRMGLPVAGAGGFGVRYVDVDSWGMEVGREGRERERELAGRLVKGTRGGGGRFV